MGSFCTGDLLSELLLGWALRSLSPCSRIQSMILPAVQPVKSTTEPQRRKPEFCRIKYIHSNYTDYVKVIWFVGLIIQIWFMRGKFFFSCSRCGYSTFETVLFMLIAKKCKRVEWGVAAQHTNEGPSVLQIIFSLLFQISSLFPVTSSLSCLLLDLGSQCLTWYCCEILQAKVK